MKTLYQHFQNILILSRHEVHARRDRASLKPFHLSEILWFTSGSEAIDHLSRKPVDLILCDSELADMDGVRFLTLLRKNMQMVNLPVVMVTLDNHKHKVLDAINAGCTGYVLRPYSLETFERHLQIAQQLELYAEIESEQLAEAKDMVSEGNFDDAIEAFEEIVSMQDEAQRYYDMGMKYLMEQLYGKAIVSFKKAVKINSLFAEAYKGMADAYKGKGDISSYTRYLTQAADIYAQFDKMEETKSLFIEILKYERHTPNPFNTLGVKLRKGGDYAGAIHAYSQALSLTPEDENVYYNLAKAYYFMGDSEKALVRLEESLAINSEFSEACALYEKITGNIYVPAEDALPKQVSDKPGSAVDVE